MPKRAILDTDIGDDIDDAFALALAITSPELRLMGVTTVHGPVEKRARIARKILNWAGKRDTPVIPGFPGCGSPEHQPNQAAWGEGIGLQPPAQAAVEYIVQEVEGSPQTVTIIAIGPLSNIAKCFEEVPSVTGKIAELIIMGGAVRKGYGGAAQPAAEYNIACDIESAARVFGAGINLTVVPLDATATLMLPDERLDAMRASRGPLAQALMELLPLWRGSERHLPVLHDPLAVSLAFDRSLGRFESLRLEVNADGMTVPVAGTPNAQVCVEADAERLFDLVVGRIAAWEAREPIA